MAGQNLGEAVLSLRTDGSGLSSGIDQAQSTAESKLQNLGATFAKAGAVMSAAITAPLLGVGAGAIQAAADLTEVSGKFDVVFGELADSTRQWTAETSEAMNRSQTDFMNYASGFQDLLVPMGFTRDEAAELSKRFVALGIDVASFNNASDPEAINALRSAIVGSAEPMLRFGVDTRVARVEQELLAMGIDLTKREATEQEKVIARLNIAYAMSADAIGDAERTSESFTNQMKGMSADLKTAGETIGLVLIPFAQKAVTAIRDLTDWFVNLDPATQEIIIGFGAAAAAIGPLLLGLSAMTFAVQPLIGLLGAGGVAGALGALGTVATGPIGLSILAVTALGFAYVKLRDNVNGYLDAQKTLAAGHQLSRQQLEETKQKLIDLGVSSASSGQMLGRLNQQIAELDVRAAAAAKGVELTDKEVTSVAATFLAAKNQIGATNLTVDQFIKGQSKTEEVVKKTTTAVTKAKEKVQDFTQSWIDWSADSRAREQALQNVIDLVGKEFADAIKDESLPALREIGAQLAYLKDRDAKGLADALRNDIPPAIQATVSAFDIGTFMMIQDAGAVGAALDKWDGQTKEASDAFGRLSTDSLAELEKMATQAEADFNTIKESGVASQENITEAWRNELAAQIALMEAQGQAIPAEQQRTLDQLNAQLKTGVEQQKTIWGGLGSDVASTLTGIASFDLFGGSSQFNLETIGGKLKGVAQSFVDSFQKPVLDSFNKIITEGIDKLIGKLTGSGGLTGALDKVFNFGGGGGGSIPSGGGGGVKPPSGLGGGGPSPIGGFDPITFGANLLMFGLDYGKQSEIETALDDIEGHTRGTEIAMNGPAGVLNNMHTYLAENEWQRHDEIKERLDDIVENTASGSGGGVTINITGPVYGYSSVAALIADINSVVRNDGVALTASELLA